MHQFPREPRAAPGLPQAAQREPGPVPAHEVRVVRPRVEGAQEHTVHPLPATPLQLAVHASHERNGVRALYKRPVVAGEELGAETRVRNSCGSSRVCSSAACSVSSGAIGRTSAPNFIPPNIEPHSIQLESLYVSAGPADRKVGDLLRAASRKRPRGALRGEPPRAKLILASTPISAGQRRRAQ
jgi:hypothetical protein